MKLTLWRDDVTMLRPVAAAAQRHEVRARLFLRLEHDGGVGFGEVSPQPRALNGDPGLDEVLDELLGVTLVQVRSVVAREGALPSWTRLARFVGSRPASAVAVALVEMALLDRELRVAQLDASSLWPHRFNTPTQTTVSLLDAEEPWIIDRSVARVRTKTAPGTLTCDSLARLSELSVPILLDFNCSATSDAQVLNQVAQIARVATIAAVEQPYAPGNLIDHATLAEQLSVPVSLDEGVRNPRDIVQIARYGAAQMVCIKPARVGGMANARSMAQKAVEFGLRPYLGGFFESPYARSVHRQLAEHCISEPSDLGVVDVVGGVDRSQLVRAAGGFGVAPSPELLEKAVVIATPA
jgi:O-succinylbenzoate synthase